MCSGSVVEILESLHLSFLFYFKKDIERRIESCDAQLLFVLQVFLPSLIEAIEENIIQNGFQ